MVLGGVVSLGGFALMVFKDLLGGDKLLQPLGLLTIGCWSATAITYALTGCPCRLRTGTDTTQARRARRPGDRTGNARAHQSRQYGARHPWIDPLVLAVSVQHGRERISRVPMDTHLIVAVTGRVTPEAEQETVGPFNRRSTSRGDLALLDCLRPFFDRDRRSVDLKPVIASNVRSDLLTSTR